MAYSADTFVADEQPTTAKWNKLWTNDASFNDGTGILASAILASHRSQVAKVGNFSLSATGAKSVTGVGYKPKFVAFDFLQDAITTRLVAARGATDGTNQYARAGVSTATPNAAGTYSTSKCLLVINTAGTVLIDAAITSLDSDGFTLNVTTYTSTYGVNFGYYAIA